MTDCIFCKIIGGTIPSQPVYTSAHVIALRDIKPLAPVHVLVMPKRHIPTLNDLQPTDGPLLLELTQAVQSIVRSEGIAESGYRLITNVNRHGGQEVFHLHLHIVGGKPLGLMGHG